MTEKTAAIIALFARNGYTVAFSAFAQSDQLCYRAVFVRKSSTDGPFLYVSGCGASIDRAVAAARRKAMMFMELWPSEDMTP